MTSKTDAWMPLYVADYLADTSRLTTEQHGAYLLIIMDYWRNGPPPDDDAVLANITRLPLAAWKKQRPTLVRFFTVLDGEWHHARIDIELCNAKANANRRSDKARKGAQARWGQGAEQCPNDTQSNAPSMPQALPEGCASPSPSSIPTDVGMHIPPEPAQKLAKARAPKTTMPTGFALSQRVRDWAAANQHFRLDEHFASFVLKAQARGYRYADWDAALMEAVRENWAGLPNQPDFDLLTPQIGGGHARPVDEPI